MTQHTVSAAPIPEKMIEQIKQDAKKFCANDKRVVDILITHEDYNLAGLLAYHEAAKKYYLIGRQELLDYGEWARVNGERHRGNLQKNGKQLYEFYLKDKTRWEESQRNS